MSRIIIVSECQYTILALNFIILSMPFPMEICILSNTSDRIQPNSSDYLILDTAHRNFYISYKYLMENLNSVDTNRTALLSTTLDSSLLCSLVKLNLNCFSKHSTVGELKRLIIRMFFLKIAPIESDKSVRIITKMESQVLSLLMAGLPLAEISLILKRSIKTVSAHKCNLFKKIGVPVNDELSFIVNHGITYTAPPHRCRCA